MLFSGYRKQSDTTYPLYFMLIASSDHITGLTGKSGSVVVTISKGTGGFGAPAGAISELGNGMYYVAGNATDSQTLGPLFIHAKDAASDPYDSKYDIVNYDPFTFLPNVNVVNINGTAQTAKDLGALNVTGVNTLAGHDPGAALVKVADLGTVQTGDNYAKVNDATIGLANLKALIDAIQVDVGDASSGTLGSLYAILGNASATLTSRLPAQLTANGNIKASLVELITTALTETSTGYLAAAFKKFLDVATPVFTAACVNQSADQTPANVKTAIEAVGSYLALIKAVTDKVGFTGSEPYLVNSQVKGQDDIDFGATQKSSITAAVPSAATIGTDAASKVLVTPAQKIVTDSNGKVTYSNAAPPSASDIKTAIEATGSDLALIKAVTDQVKFTGTAPNTKVNAQIQGTDDIDFSTTQKSSLNAATPAATISDKTGFSLSNDGVKAIWEYATRTLSSFGSLVSDIATAVWAAGARTLTAFGFSVTVGTNNDKSGYSVSDKTGFSLLNPSGIRKNSALGNFEFQMTDSNGEAATGQTVTAERSIDGGAYSACANSVSEVGSGTYKIDLAAADLNGDVVTLKFTASGAKATVLTIKTNQ